ncbi:hypothetical protein [Desulfobulbus propionicus]|uniref:hypothetical protein n=1 Tax=Desulfobulbus propionicus TaxID=894 RepID=UPI0002F80A00|nr:hypothetical protein [Desulfobulbus propionicus]
MLEIVHLPEQYYPPIEDMPGDLRRVADAIEEHLPGSGVRLTLLLAQIFHGQPVYFRSVKRFITAWQHDCIRAEYDQGGCTAKVLATKFRLSMRTVEKILASPATKNMKTGTSEQLERRQ